MCIHIANIEGDEHETCLRFLKFISASVQQRVDELEESPSIGQLAIDGMADGQLPTLS